MGGGGVKSKSNQSQDAQRRRGYPLVVAVCDCKSSARWETEHKRFPAALQTLAVGLPEWRAMSPAAPELSHLDEDGRETVRGKHPKCGLKNRQRQPVDTSREQDAQTASEESPQSVRAGAEEEQ